MIWNSCTASCETVERTPLTELSVASAPSTFTRFDARALPAHVQPEVGAAPVLGALSRTTCESVRVKLM